MTKGKRMKELYMNKPYYDILKSIKDSDKGEIHLSEISRTSITHLSRITTRDKVLFMVDPSLVKRQTKILEKTGFLQLRKKGNPVYISLTKKGENLYRLQCMYFKIVVPLLNEIKEDYYKINKVV